MEYMNYVKGDKETTKHRAIRAAGTGDAVRIVYEFQPGPDIQLTPKIEANVGGLLTQTSTGGTTNSNPTGIEGTDAKFDTKDGYVKKGSETIGDVPSVVIGFDANGSTSEWKKLFNNKDFTGIYMILTVKRELSSTGSLPENAGTTKWAFNLIRKVPRFLSGGLGLFCFNRSSKSC
jgi:hypothetical protein